MNWLSRSLPIEPVIRVTASSESERRQVGTLVPSLLNLDFVPKHEEEDALKNDASRKVAGI